MQLVVLLAPNARDAAVHDCPATPTMVRLPRVSPSNGRVVHVVMSPLLDPGSSCKSNRSLAIDKIKRQIACWLLIATTSTTRDKPIFEEIALHVQRFDRDRARPRKPQAKPCLSHAYL